MTPPELPAHASRQELRKALIRLRLEMHRQEIRHETRQLLQPLHKARSFTGSLPRSLGLGSAPAWGIGALAALGLLTRKRRGLVRLVRIGTLLYPLLMVALRRPGSPPSNEPPAKI
ncbi:hypothetical protein JQX08_09450 [Pseudomonas sp. UL073]|uniref:DUF3618 domain-containing protein n=1 Tax=Zestomonas insulae TaxID=2809017 RepID=A0ABS2IDU9_9GAMM|nr:hypothetical protein [Pseudomonas insulae]MBM7060930.1 hypothetical protein [Pseudomonas insulae]